MNQGKLIAAFNKARGCYLWQELHTIREAVMGSQALIAHIDNGHPPEALLEGAFGGGADMIASLVFVLNSYISEIALGDAVLRARQKLLPLPAAPPRDIQMALYNSKPDWTELYEYVDIQLKVGSLRDDPAWSPHSHFQGRTWRARLEDSVHRLNHDFVVGYIKNLLSIPAHDDMLIMASAEVLANALATVEPLNLPTPAFDPMAMLGMASDSPAELSRGYMDGLRTRGASVMAVLAQDARAKGVSLFQQATSLKGEAQKERFFEALKIYGPLTLVLSESCVSYSNIAAIYLLMEEWEYAQESAKAAGLARESFAKTRPTYASKRAAVISALITGHAHDIAQPMQRPLTQAQIAADRSIAWKCAVRWARASAGLCRSLIKVAPAALSEQNRARARTELETAKARYQEALELDSSNQVPVKELEALVADYQAAMKL